MVWFDHLEYQNHSFRWPFGSCLALVFCVVMIWGFFYLAVMRFWICKFLVVHCEICWNRKERCSWNFV